ncbi:Hypothetical protein A7982_06646 [Minicystis rosea]|nr:Hypothetical protein A7982_06646 [Minicystis rosea]
MLMPLARPRTPPEEDIMLRWIANVISTSTCIGAEIALLGLLRARRSVRALRP